MTSPPRWVRYVDYAGKAVIAGGVSFAGTLGVALADAQVSGVEWTGIALATLVAVGGVFGWTNGPKPS